MCGIGGIVHLNGAPADRVILRRMADRLQHRGPDDRGIYVNGPAGLVHTRLSVIDLSSRGHQPMQSEDGRFILIYNGEIYNYGRIKEILSTKGYRFRGRSDTEVVLYACMEWGADALSRFEGMFAMALWDSKERHLYLARDRMGMKPLYYCKTKTGLVFGSEIKALLASGEIDAQVDWSGIHEFLHYQAALDTRTVFAGVKKLLPGHVLTLDLRGIKVEAYASVYDVDRIQDDYPTAVEKVKHLFDRAIKSHLIGDVPVGVFLSSGIDSSAIVAFASRHYRDRLKTFTVGFGGREGVSELPRARMIAKHFGTDHHELQISGKDLPATIEQLVYHHDSPFGNTGSIPMYLLAREMKSDAKVILQGDGGDEIFAGYRRHFLASRQRRLQVLAFFTKWVRPFVPRNKNWYQRFCALQNFNYPDPSMRFALLMSNAPKNYSLLQCFSPQVRSLLQAEDPYRCYREYYHRFKHLDPLARALCTDIGIILPNVYFEKVDKSTMAHGVEARVPMADTRLAAYVMGLPIAYKLRGQERKRIFRRVLRGTLPDTLLNRSKKIGLKMPIGNWLRTSLVEYMQSVLLDESTHRTGLFDKKYLARCIRDHVSGNSNNEQLLYALIHLTLWWRAYVPKA